MNWKDGREVHILRHYQRGIDMSFRTIAVETALVLFLTEMAAAEEMTWYKATEILQRERVAGEVCARVMKRHIPKAEKAALSRAELNYEAAREEFNGVVAGLQAALIDDTEKPALEMLTKRVEVGSERRRAFCDDAESRLPAAQKGEKSVIGDIAAAAIGEVIGAVVAVWKELGDDDELRRTNLRTALDDVKWPKFSEIPP
jgi:hypothetical protein